MTDVGMFFLAFLAGAVLDFTWTLCVESVQQRRAALAAHLAVVLYVCTLFSTVLIVEQCVPAVIAYGLGNWVGTYYAVKRSHK
jgi:hypothetical protein